MEIKIDYGSDKETKSRDPVPSHRRFHHRQRYDFRRVLWCLLIVIAFSVPVLGYGVWGEPEEDGSIDRLDEIISGLDESINRAILGRSAHPAFIQDLQTYLTELIEYRKQIALDYEVRNDLRRPTFGVPQHLRARFTFSRDFYDDFFGVVTNEEGNYEISFEPPVFLGGRGLIDRSALIFPDENHSGAVLNADLSRFSAFTLEMWINIADWGPHGSGYARLLTDYGDSGGLLLMLNKGSSYNTNSLVVSVNGYRVSTEPNSLSLGRWHHIAVIHDGQALSVVIDGRDQDLRRNTGFDKALELPRTDTYFIGNNRNQNRRFAGMIDEIKIWDSAREITDIREDIRRVR